MLALHPELILDFESPAVAEPGVLAHAGRTDVGLTRTGNEDAFAILDEAKIFAVCDGMGGHAAGEVASGIAIEALQSYYRTPVTDWVMPDEHLAAAVRLAHFLIVHAAQATEARTGMGTTIVAAAVTDDEIHIAHVGDSRAYRLRDGRLERLTRDHSLLEEMKMLNPGMTAEEERAFPKRNVITRALGSHGGSRVTLRSERLRPGDRFLLCSDGLTGMLEDEVVAACLDSATSPTVAVDELIELANLAGGTDNITAVVIDWNDARS
jgi:protein phosphatase